VVAAQEIEVALTPEQAERCAVDGALPELFFCRDLEGYGWVFRKQDHVNIGFGRRQTRDFPAQAAAFWTFLTGLRRVPDDLPRHWPGHAYLLYEGPGRRVVDDGVLLVGDAAGLAYAQSGEGIRPAIESGLLAAATVLAAAGRYGREALEPYGRALTARFGPRPPSDPFRLLPAALRDWIGGRVLASRFWSRRLVVDRWFLHRQQPALAGA
jgi:flavin-dependent dehydrogenase